jgi:hypothetical protein
VTSPVHSGSSAAAFHVAGDYPGIDGLQARCALDGVLPEAAYYGALAEHQRQFPQGLLSVERRAARAQALCQLGRKAEAERELRGLSPSSPQAARARKLCSSK